MHGHSFEVIDMGTMDDYNTGRSYYTNATHLPVIKDTVIVPRNGYVRIRFKATNPGYWLLHCHFEYHMFIGMWAILKVGKHEDMVPPPKQFPTCGNYLISAYET